MTDRELTMAYSTSQNIQKLERLIVALREGKESTIQVAGESIKVPADAAFSIEHEREDGM